MRSCSVRLALAVVAIGLAGCGSEAASPLPLPLSFTENRGQFAPEVRFAARTPGLELAATDRGLALTAGGRRVRMAFAGARPVRPAAGAALPGVANYLLGADRRRWRTHVPTYRGIVYRQPWPRVDVAVYGAGGRLEYDLRLAPGADPAAVRLDFGAAPVRVEHGALRAGALRLLAPRAYQRGALVPSAYRRLADGTVGFRLGRYDRRAPLVIDPVLAYSTYLGGTGNDDGRAIAADAAGAAYVTGKTQSGGRDDAFVTKLAPDGASVAWTTYVGGSGIDEGNAIALASGGVLVAGMTTSTDLPTQRPVQLHNGGNQDAFLIELSPAGDAVTFGSYLGGPGFDWATAVAAGPGGDAYLAGVAGSPGFPAGPGQGAGDDGFAARIDVATPLVRYARFLGGDGNDHALGVAVDGAGNGYVTGFTGSSDFPTANPLQAHGAGLQDAFLTKLDPLGAPVYSTYLGGTGLDEGHAIALAPAGAAVVAGVTQSPDFPTSPHGDRHGPSDAFFTRVRADGTLDASAYLGGSGVEEAGGVAADGAGHIVVAGRTNSDDLPLAGPVQDHRGGALDAFAMQLTAAGAPLVSTYLGGGGDDQGHAVALDAGGNAYLTGSTQGGFPTAGAVQPTPGGATDAFVTRLAIGSALPAPAPIPPAPPPPPPVEPETAIVARPPARTPDRVVRFRFTGKMPGQINPAGGVTFGCRVDGGAFSPCASPFTTRTLSVAGHTFDVRAVSAGGVADSTPAAFAFRVTRPPPELRTHSCALKPNGPYHDRGTRDWGPCALPDIVCPKAALCLLDLAVDDHDDSYLFNYDVHLQRLEAGAYKDRVFCFAPALTVPVNPRLEVRFDPRRGEHNRHHACHADGVLGLVNDAQDVRLRYRCAGFGHAPRPGGDRTTGAGFEDNAHLECRVGVTVQRQGSELGQAVDAGANALLVYAPAPGRLTVAGPRLKPTTVKARRAGAVRAPLRLKPAARAARRKRAVKLSVTTTFRPAAGAAVTRVSSLKLRRRR